MTTLSEPDTAAGTGQERPAGEQIVIQAFRVARTLGSADRSIGGPPRAWLLHRLALTPGIRVADLAGECGLDASTASRHVRTLEDAGLLARVGDPEDRRAARLSLTPAGQDALDLALRVRGDLVARATSRWSAADRGSLSDLLSRLSDDLVAACTPNHPHVAGPASS
ncbi:MAG: MarR family transcriptional regulator [Geodermatophilaceae bacterium]|nr:MarR family transcriptional regulator [Geodermatophilaceae bacterium]